MLSPFDWTVLTYEDAKTLVDFIEKVSVMNGKAGLDKDYHKMVKLGIFEVYQGLREFVERSEHYHNHLRNLDTLRLIYENED